MNQLYESGYSFMNPMIVPYESDDCGTSYRALRNAPAKEPYISAKEPYKTVTEQGNRACAVVAHHTEP